MKFKYVRIQGTELAENTMYAKGIFSMCVQLARNDVMDGALSGNRLLDRGGPAFSASVQKTGERSMLL